MLKIPSKLLVIVGCILLLASCDNKTIYSNFKSTGNSWAKADTMSFKFEGPDTINNYNMFVNLRNNQEYAYSNLFLIVNLNYPNGKVASDTLEYLMAEPSGEWLGTGFSSVKENKLWYKKGIKFPETGTYRVDVLQAMRKNGSINGVVDLKGVTDVGVSIEKK